MTLHILPSLLTPTISWPCQLFSKLSHQSRITRLATAGHVIRTSREFAARDSRGHSWLCISSKNGKFCKSKIKPSTKMEMGYFRIELWVVLGLDCFAECRFDESVSSSNPVFVDDLIITLSVKQHLTNWPTLIWPSTDTQEKWNFLDRVQCERMLNYAKCNRICSACTELSGKSKHGIVRRNFPLKKKTKRNKISYLRGDWLPRRYFRTNKTNAYYQSKQSS